MFKSQADITNVINRIIISEAGFVCKEQDLTTAILKRLSRQSSWVVKILMVIGAFLAASFLSSFIFLNGLQKSGIGLVVVGLLLIMGTLFLIRYAKELFLETFCVSYFITGYLLLGIGCNLLKLSDNQYLMSFIAISISVFFLTRNYLMMMIAVLVFSGSLLYLIHQNKIHALAHVYILVYAVLMVLLLLKEAWIITRFRQFAILYQPLRISIIIGLLLGFLLIGNKNMFRDQIPMIWISSVITGGLILYFTKYVLTQFHFQKSSILIQVIIGLIILTTLFSPAITGAFLIILTCFYVNFKPGIAIGIVAGIYFVAQFYYDMNETLLIKSMLLLGAGILFMALYFFTDKYLLSDEKV